MHSPVEQQKFAEHEPLLQLLAPSVGDASVQESVPPPPPEVDWHAPQAPIATTFPVFVDEAKVPQNGLVAA